MGLVQVWSPGVMANLQQLSELMRSGGAER
jgi:hypothetical protein